jgi:hypothetical protein
MHGGIRESDTAWPPELKVPVSQLKSFSDVGTRLADP